MLFKINSYRADAYAFENKATMVENHLEFDLGNVDYITSEGFSAIIRLLDQNKKIKLINYNEHIKETVELVNLSRIL